MGWSLTPKYKLSPQLEALRRKWGGEAIQDKISGTIALKNKNGIFRDSGIATNAKGQTQQFDLKSGHFIINNPVERGRQNLIRLIPKYGGNVRRNSSGNWELVNNNGVFYASGTARDNQGRERTFDINSGHFTDGLGAQKTQKPSIESKVSANSDTSKPNTSTSSTTSRSRTALAPKAPTSNSWINKDRGIWNYNGVSQADVANAYKTGDFSKVGSYLSQHKDLASYLNNIYSKRGGNQFNQSTQTPTVNTMTLQTLDNVVPKSPVKEITPTAELPTAPTPTYNRSQTRDYMRSIGMNPYDYSGGERKALRTYLNNPGSMDSKYQPFINQVQNQRTQKMVDSIGTNQLLKPETDTNKLNNQLVNLKFKKGGQMYKYAAGAQMVQPQQASGQQGIEQQAMALVQAAMQGDQQANQTIQKIMQAAQQGDQQAAQVAQLLKAIVQKMKGSRKARLGAKLDYIKQSIGECPEGQEVVYFKKGGEICKVCAGKKMQDGGKSDPIKNFKKKKEQDAVKQAYQRNPYTRGKSAKEIAEMQRRNRQEASAGKGENDAKVAPWNYKKKR